mgnify:CR=1 FL=1
MTQIRTGDQNFTDTTDDDYLGLYEISSIIKHPNYKRPGYGARNDLALVFTKTKIEFNARTNKIGTFTSNYNLGTLFETFTFQLYHQLITQLWNQTQTTQPSLLGMVIMMIL